MNWRIKASIQKILASLPGNTGSKFNKILPELLRPKHVDYSMRSLEIAKLHSLPLSFINIASRPRNIFELGTGYNMFAALPFCLMGYKVTTCDVSRDVTWNSTRSLLLNFKDRLKELCVLPASLADLNEMTHKYNYMLLSTSLEDFLERSKIDYLAPYNMNEFMVRSKNGFGYIFSHCVFEHLSPLVFPPILNMLHAIGTPDSLFSHQVDLRDHRSSEGSMMDRNLSYLAHLKLSESQWNFWNNNQISYVNRWRKSNYIKVLVDHGFRITDTLDSSFAGAFPEKLSQLQPEFRIYPEAELRVMGTFISGTVEKHV